MKKILLTGATGFIGCHVLERLLSEKYDVVVLKRSSSDVWRISHLLDKITLYDVDCESLESIFVGNSIDTIIHLATLYSKYDKDAEISKMIDANVSFPVRLLEVAIRHKVKAFINTGTFFEYNCSNSPVNEDANLEPVNLYAKTKLAFECLLKTYSTQLNVTTLRIFSPYGEKDNIKLIPMVIKNALDRNITKLSDDGFQKLDFIYISDIVDAYLKVLEKSDHNAIGYQVYNLGSGISTSVREVVSIVEKHLDYAVNVEWGPISEKEMSFVSADITKIKREFGWFPKVSIDEGIGNLIRHYERECK